jgi:Flp pilus assembly protein TadG
MKPFLKNTCGNVAIMFGLGAIPLLVAVGAAVDMVQFNHVETVLQSAADAAALAAAAANTSSNHADVSTVVNDYLKANNAFAVLKSVTGVTQTIDSKTGILRVSVKGQYDTNFLSIVGISSMQASASAEVNFSMKALEIALVLDNTGSMAGSKIANLKTSAKQLVKILEDQKSSFADLKFGLVPFAQYVNVGTNNAAALWMNVPATVAPEPAWNGCVGSRDAPLDEQSGAVGGAIPGVLNVNCPAPITPLTTNTSKINSEIDAMVAGGNTYIPTGLLWGWNVLDAQEPYTEGRTPAQLAEVGGRKAIVLMTDGENTASPLYPDHKGTDADAANAKLATMCANVKAQGIEVFTVAFQVPTPTIKAILESCATSADHAFDAANGQALYDSFTKIGQLLADVRISK